MTNMVNYFFVHNFFLQMKCVHQHFHATNLCLYIGIFDVLITIFKLTIANINETKLRVK